MLRKGQLLSANPGASCRSSGAKGGGLSRCVGLWIADGQAAGWSPRSIASRRHMLGKCSWWPHQAEIPERPEAITAGNIRLCIAYLKLFHWLGKTARIRDVRCSPDTGRHYFAVTMLRYGANLFELQQ